MGNALRHARQQSKENLHSEQQYGSRERGCQPKQMPRMPSIPQLASQEQRLALYQAGQQPHKAHTPMEMHDHKQYNRLNINYL